MIYCAILGISVHYMVEEGNDDPLEEATAKIEVGGRGTFRARMQTYPSFLKFQAIQSHRHRIHMKTFQHQQSNHLNHRHLHLTDPVLLVTHPELSLQKRKKIVSIID